MSHLLNVVSRHDAVGQAADFPHHRELLPVRIDQQILHELEKGMAPDPERNANTCFIEVTPEGDFLTYGIDVPATAMGDPEKAMGRVAVD